MVIQSDVKEQEEVDGFKSYIEEDGLNLVAASLWEAMVSRMTLKLPRSVLRRMLEPLKKKSSYFIVSLLCLLVARNPATFIASRAVFLLCYPKKNYMCKG